MFKAVFLFLTLALFSFSLPVSTKSISEKINLSRTDEIRREIEKNYSFESTPSTRKLYQIVASAIVEANPSRRGLDDEEELQISREVVQVAQCYGVDPVIFTALIWRESNFKPTALSSRGAVGLTQMTSIGLREVLDRLNPKSNRRLDHLRFLVKKCNPALARNFPRSDSTRNLENWRHSIAHSPLEAMVVGALLLKINLAATSHRLNQVSIYRSALEKYNGDRKVKEQFALDVFQISKRLTSFPEIPSNNSKFLASIQDL